MSVRNEINDWMIQHVSEFNNSVNLAKAALVKFPDVIGVDTFIWDDAESLMNLYQLTELAKRYA